MVVNDSLHWTNPIIVVTLKAFAALDSLSASMLVIAIIYSQVVLFMARLIARLSSY